MKSLETLAFRFHDAATQLIEPLPVMVARLAHGSLQQCTVQPDAKVVEARSQWRMGVEWMGHGQAQHVFIQAQRHALQMPGQRCQQALAATLVQQGIDHAAQGDRPQQRLHEQLRPGHFGTGPVSQQFLLAPPVMDRDLKMVQELTGCPYHRASDPGGAALSVDQGRELGAHQAEACVGRTALLRVAAAKMAKLMANDRGGFPLAQGAETR